MPNIFSKSVKDEVDRYAAAEAKKLMNYSKMQRDGKIRKECVQCGFNYGFGKRGGGISKLMQDVKWVSKDYRLERRWKVKAAALIANVVFFVFFNF